MGCFGEPSVAQRFLLRLEIGRVRMAEQLLMLQLQPVRIAVAPTVSPETRGVRRGAVDVRVPELERSHRWYGRDDRAAENERDFVGGVNGDHDAARRARPRLDVRIGEEVLRAQNALGF